MAIKCGFFNSIKKDRLYQAEDMNEPYKGLISNGVFATQEGTPSNYLQVYAGSGMTVTVKAGRGIFADKWFLNDADMSLTLDTPEVTLNRIDSVVVKVDKSEAVRGASIVVKKGTASSSPVAPSLTRNDLVYEYRLANITVTSGASSIKQTNIADMRGSSDCPWVTSLIQQVDTSTLYIQWQEAFDDWFKSIKETLSTATLIRSYNSTHKTTTQDETVIPINITQFNRNLDILQVYINGLMLIKDVEYTNDNNDTITLTNGVDKGTPVSFVVYKSIDGSEAETVVQQVYELQNIVEASRITNTTGGVKISITDTSKNVLDEFANAGIGFHTIYSASGVQGLPKTGACRLMGHLTADNNGWIMGFYTQGSVFCNYLLGGTWSGWRKIYDATPSPLWTGGSFMNASASITVSKKLSECANGWILVWADYDDSTSTANSFDVVTTVIPKLNAVGNAWNGSSMLCTVPVSLSEEGVANITAKRLYIFDDHIEGYAGNAVGTTQRDVVLRAIYEY